MVEFFGWTLHFSKKFKVYMDKEAKRMALLTQEDDEIHITIEMVENQLVFNPRWNIKIVFIGDKEVDFQINS